MCPSLLFFIIVYCLKKMIYKLKRKMMKFHHLSKTNQALKSYALSLTIKTIKITISGEKNVLVDII